MKFETEVRLFLDTEAEHVPEIPVFGDFENGTAWLYVKREDLQAALDA